MGSSFAARHAGSNPKTVPIDDARRDGDGERRDALGAIGHDESAPDADGHAAADHDPEHAADHA